ncbi:histone deacetylase [Actinomadura sp. HBU206391]|uniref:histone deacetylase n=1 Tax=Actinomadura sp. HBU206391 TaxID=2731692 RepID=UPI00164FEF94|nr:histone deacetylase [Actinomadura sp. HBU206391]MBC6461794.1 histone deacetylase [Actinomadura sp. HBU206391]
MWYVAYGSNLDAGRFACYLTGGRPPGAARDYGGCRDRLPPRADRPVLLPGGIYFALTSRVWGGGMAFYDPDLPGETAARAYLLSRSQFADVLAQEMHREVGTDLDLSEVLATGRQRVGAGRYETIVKVGEAGGRPMLSFTAPHGAARAELNAPSVAYLSVLGRGLRESHGWSAERTAAYLSTRPGASGRWSAGTVAALLTGSPVPSPRRTPGARLEPT